ncbi:putative lrr receptor-like serine/threonine-protein kinase [Quercus suber]|uniref:Lrr receptor-like serine/threonine-protein kinase n=1 Tax=Quercus suber TaxID=58331 RepID=A0AAW0JD05_QUESU
MSRYSVKFIFICNYNGGVLRINLSNTILLTLNWSFALEKLVWEDFDIENSARGVDKAVVVEHTSISTRGIYGPLISAISVESDFILPDNEDNKMKISIVVGAIVLVLLLIFMILGILWWKGNLGGRIQGKMVIYANPDEEIIKEGILSDGTLIAVKQLLSKSKQGSREFVNEIGMILAYSIQILLDCMDVATVLQNKGDLMELVDPELGSKFSKEEVLRMIKVALLCTNPSPALRPTMTAVVSMLEGQTDVDEVARDPSLFGDEWRFEALRDQFGRSPQLHSVEGQSLVQSSNATWIGSSSTSAHDLFH